MYRNKKNGNINQNHTEISPHILRRQIKILSIQPSQLEQLGTKKKWFIRTD